MQHSVHDGDSSAAFQEAQRELRELFASKAEHFDNPNRVEVPPGRVVTQAEIDAVIAKWAPRMGGRYTGAILEIAAMMMANPTLAASAEQ